MTGQCIRLVSFPATRLFRTDRGGFRFGLPRALASRIPQTRFSRCPHGAVLSSEAMKAGFRRRFLATSPVTLKTAPPPAEASPDPAPARPLQRVKNAMAAGISFAGHALKSSLSVIVIAVLAIVVWALMVRLIFPKPLIVVDAFDVSSDVEKAAGLSGKNAADIITDTMNAAADAGERFKGNDYASPHHYGMVRNVFRIPVQTTYGIQISGISVDVLMDIYRRFRYDEWRISGDVVKGEAEAGRESATFTVRLRMRRNSGSEYWEQTNVASGRVNSAVQELAREVLSTDRPELMGRSHLQWAISSDHPLERLWHYEQALQVFRQWALREPTNPLPYYYMAVTYHYYGDRGHESSEMAGWSEDTLHDKELWEKGWLQSAKDWFAAYRHGPGKSNDTESYAEGLEASAELLMEKSKPLDDSADLAAFLTQRQEALDHLNRAEALLARLDAKGAPDADTEENLATAKSLRADVLMADMPAVKGPQPASLGDLRRAYRDEQDAIALMTEILRQEPDSAGFHKNLATMYLNAGELAGKLEQQGQSLAASETPAACYRLAATEAEQALHLYPQLSEGLSLASEALSSLEDASPPEGDAARHERLRLCQTMALILPQMHQPESCPAPPETLMENVAAVPLTPQTQPTKAPQAFQLPAVQPKVSKPQAPPPQAREAAR